MNRRTRSRQIQARRRFELEFLEARQLLASLFSTEPDAWSITDEPTSATASDFSTDSITSFSEETPENTQPSLQAWDQRPFLVFFPMPLPAPDPEIAATVPASGSSVSTSLTSLTIIFSHPVSLIDGVSTDDFQLVRINDDGTETPLPDSILESVTFDDLGTEVTISLGRSIPSGRFRLDAVAGGWLSSRLSGPSWDSTQDQELTEFTVESSGVSLSDAIDLGLVSTTQRDVPGWLDFSGGWADVSLYRIQLDAGHTWRLAAEVSADRIGSPLRPSLTIFDAEGHVVAVCDSGTGEPGSPRDPYVFEGLKPGVYYVGVSGAGNLGGTVIGYDPATRAMGSVELDQPGGPFVLHVAADPIDTPTTVIASSLVWGDPLSSQPTGLVLAFSGPIDPNSLKGTYGPDYVLRVVDSNGRSWSISPADYDPSRDLLTLSFDQPLPPGQYRLLIKPEGGLTDLIGEAPTTPGRPARTLASWTVSSPSSLDPVQGSNDLGILWPSSYVGDESTSTVAPGTAETYRVVILMPGFYRFRIRVDQGSITILKTGADGLHVVGESDGPGIFNPLIYLTPGVYNFRFVGTGTEATSFAWQFRAVDISWESILDNGLGQASAMTLRLSSPLVGGLIGSGLPSFTPAAPLPGPASGGSSGGPASGSGSGSFSGAAQGLPRTPALSPGGLMMALPSNLFGSPMAGGLSSALTGSAGSSLSALAPRTIPSVYQDRNREGQTLRAWVSLGDAIDAETLSGESDTSTTPSNRNGTASSGHAIQPETSAPDADEETLDRVDRTLRIISNLGEWLSPLPNPWLEPEGGFDPREWQLAGDDPLIVAHAEGRLRNEGDASAGGDGEGDAQLAGALATGRIETARLAGPIGLVVVASMIYRWREPVVRWWRRRRQRLATAQFISKPVKVGGQPPLPVPLSHSGHRPPRKPLRTAARRAEPQSVR
jgi:hypothetical protein